MLNHTILGANSDHQNERVQDLVIFRAVIEVHRLYDMWHSFFIIFEILCNKQDTLFYHASLLLTLNCQLSNFIFFLALSILYT